MPKQIDVSYGKDLRQPEWKIIDSEQNGDTVTINHLDPLTNKKFMSKTRFAPFNDMFDKPVILYQEIWEEEN